MPKPPWSQREPFQVFSCETISIIFNLHFLRIESVIKTYTPHRTRSSPCIAYRRYVLITCCWLAPNRAEEFLPPIATPSEETCSKGERADNVSCVFPIRVGKAFSLDAPSQECVLKLYTFTAEAPSFPAFPLLHPNKRSTKNFSLDLRSEPAKVSEFYDAFCCAGYRL